MVLSSLALLLSGCANNVLFLSRGDSEGRPDEVSLFFDREGDLYPSGSIVIAPPIPSAQIKEFFRQPDSQRAWAELLAAEDVRPGTNFDTDWARVQERLRLRAARNIAAHSDGGRKPVAFIIHGFNNSYEDSSGWYKVVAEEMRKVLRDHGKAAPLVVKVYWDGLKQAGLPVNIWTRAQYNAPIVGLGMRRLLRETDRLLIGSNPVVLFTHSTGALVAVNAVGNGSAPFRCELAYKHVCERLANEALPNVARYRLGLLIPAASLDTFKNFNANGPGPQLISVGTNHLDLATSRGPLSCTFLGATCMATWTSNTCNLLREKFAGNPRIKTSLFEFRKSEGGDDGRTLVLWEKHGMESQLLRDRWRPFLTALLVETAVVEDDSTRWCTASPVVTNE